MFIQKKTILKTKLSLGLIRRAMAYGSIFFDLIQSIWSSGMANLLIFEGEGEGEGEGNHLLLNPTLTLTHPPLHSSLACTQVYDFFQIKTRTVETYLF